MDSHECPIPESKGCSKCGEVKPLGDFAQSRGRHESACKACKNERSRQHYLKNRERVLQRTQAYKAANQEKVAAMLADWYQRNKERVLARSAEYRNRPGVRERELERQRQYYAARKEQIQAKRKAKWNADPERRARFNAYLKKHYAENRHVYQEKSVRRNRALYEATPPWADLAAIREIYKKCAEINASSDTKYVVDHIVPLRGRNVCGLHIAENLRIISALENLQKHNKLLEG